MNKDSYHCKIYIDEQILELIRNNIVEKSYLISTAKKGIGSEENSFKTPLGKHFIIEKHGDNAPIYSIFKGRKNTGEICKELNKKKDENLILSRILRLMGKEEGKNLGYKDGICIDTYKRYVYIHGTCQEKKLGTPQSIGCITMSNKDIIEIYDKLDINSDVDILKSKKISS